MDVEIASRFSASSGVSRPATSESDGLLDRYHLEKDDDEDDDNDGPNPSKTAGKRKRDVVLKSEV